MLDPSPTPVAPTVDPKKRRTAIKGWLTRGRKNLESFIDGQNHAMVKVELGSLKKRMEELTIVQRMVEDQLADENAVSAEIDKEAPFIDACNISIAAAESYIASISSVVSPKSDSEAIAQKFLKPKLEIRKFEGELLEWMPFIQSFDNSVGKLKGLPNSIKLQILNENLLGEAAATIKFFSKTDENYKPAYDALVEKYGDSDRLIDAYIEQLLELREKGQSLSIRHIYDELLCSVKTLETLKVGSDQYAVILVPLLRTIFQRPIKLKWAKYERKSKQDHKKLVLAAQTAGTAVPQPTNRLTLFLDFLKEEVEIQESAGVEENTKPKRKEASETKSPKIDLQSKPTGTFNNQTREVQQNRQSSDWQQSREPRGPRGRGGGSWNQNYRRSGPPGRPELRPELPPCPFCMPHSPGSNQHHPAFCGNAHTFSPSEIIALLNRDRRCHLCFSYHPRTPCKFSERPCPLCNAKHHALLCGLRAGYSASSRLAEYGISRQGQRGTPAVTQLVAQSIPQLPPGTSLVAQTQPAITQLVGQSLPQSTPGVLSLQTPTFSQPSGTLLADVHTAPLFQPLLSFSQPMTSTPGVTPTPGFLVNVNKSQPSQDQTLLPTATVRAVTDSNQIIVRLLMDCGSQRSYITKALAQQIQAKVIRTEHIQHSVFGGRITETTCPVVEVTLQSRKHQPPRQITVQLLAVDCISNSTFPIISQIDKFAHLQSLVLADSDQYRSLRLHVLIGMDYFWSITTTEVRKGLDSDPVAIGSIFGYLISGGTPSALDSGQKTLLTFPVQTKNAQNRSPAMEKLIRQFFEIESLGISEDELCSNDDIATRRFASTVEFDGTRYNVGLTWRPDHPPLESNFSSVRMRQNKSNQKLAAKPELLSGYEDSLQEFIDCNYVEEVPPCTPPRGKENYMPHRPQIKATSSTYKIRPVFDAGAKDYKGNSLNSSLLPGPSLIPDLLKTKIRWRSWIYGFIGDLKRAFLQIGVILPDRDVLRFFYQDKIFRFARVPFGVTCSPFLLNATLRHHLQEWKSKATSQEEVDLLEEFAQCFYVDDYVSGSDTTTSGVQKAQFATRVMKDGGFELRSWITNSPELSQNIENSGCELSSETKTRVLGTDWDSSTDKISVRSVEWSEGPITVRNVAKNVPKAFDVLGLNSPIIIRAKIALSKILRLGIDWDSLIEDPVLLQELEIIREDFRKLHEIQISRHYFNGLTVSSPCSLHLFCDASKDAICACIYIVCDSRSAFVTAKTKIAPTTVTEIPRLEILACLVGAKLLSTVKPELEHFQIESTFCWTDSTAALSWIKFSRENEKRPIWIKNRISKINQMTSHLTWNYVHTDSNPADLGTRPKLTINELKNAELWWKGPEFFIKPREFWPECPIQISESKLGQTENDICPEPDTPILTAKVVEPELFLDLSQRSRLLPALKIAAYALRFIYRKRQPLPYSDVILTTNCGKKVSVPSREEIERAKLLLLKRTQKDYFYQEISEFMKTGSVSTKNRYYSLRPTLDTEGLLRTEGRTHRNPIMLPNYAPFTKLIILDTHEKNFHVGVNQTLSEIQREYWIPRGRQEIKRVLKNCLICHRHRVKPYKQVPAALPTFRLNEDYAFSACGIDFAGPLYHTKGKAYILLITCASTRAIHMELTHDQSTISVINAIKMARARRTINGHIKFIISDNAKYFKKAKKELGEIEWCFIPEYAPWWGGFWERLNRSIKAALRKVLGRANLTFEELRTLLVEIEAVINRRPLTYVSDSRDDLRCISPIDFLLTPGPPPLAATSTVLQMKHRLKHRVSVVGKVWQRWRKEYLNELHRWRLKELGSTLPTVGDVVLMEPNSHVTNRALFPLGRITKLNIGADGYCRSAYIQVGDQEVRRTTRHLYPLETSISPK